MTDDDAEVVSGDAGAAIVDAEVARRVQKIAARLSLPRTGRDVSSRRGTGDLRSVRYRGGSDDIDLEATVAQLIEHPVPEDEDIVVRERMSTRRSVVLAVDVSGSMSGERARTAAATVGALYAELSSDRVAVVAFWSDASLLVPLGQPSNAQRVLDMLLRLPSRGLTNVSFPLEVAAQQLARVPSRDARVLLLSDCVHNAGPDPREIASRLPRLDVVLDTSAEHDVDLGRDLALVGRGRLATAATYRDVAPGLSRIFAQ